MLGVNLWGVIHGIRAFVPLMIEQDEEGHVINTSSVHGLTSGPGISVYAASKHAVTRISEGLFYDLESRNSEVKCSLLSPADVATDLDLAARNRPPSLQEPIGARHHRSGQREAGKINTATNRSLRIRVWYGTGARRRN